MTQTKAVTYVFQVKPEHIAAGVKNNCYLCPVARAIQDRFPEAKHVYAGARKIRWTEPCGQRHEVLGVVSEPCTEDAMHEITMPEAVQRLIRKYDSGFGMEPFSFEVRDIQTVED